MNHFQLNTDAAALKHLLPQYLEGIGCKPRMKPDGLKLEALCPLHADSDPSLMGKKTPDSWVWFCHPCGEGGTALELHAKRMGLDTKTQFPRICREVAEILKDAPVKTPPSDQRIYPRTKMDTPPIPTDELIAITTPWREILYHETGLREKFATSLGLSPDLLKYASRFPLDGMGIAPAGYKWTLPDGKWCTLRESTLAYIGDGYFKLRAPFGGDRGPRFLMVGQPRRPWLSGVLVHDTCPVNDVHLHESETSALTLIEAGFWDFQYTSSIVVATSGSGGFKPEWCPLFGGRTVHFWPDADEAGKKFAETTAGLLHGTASKIIFHDWNPNSTNA